MPLSWWNRSCFASTTATKTMSFTAISSKLVLIRSLCFYSWLRMLSAVPQTRFVWLLGRPGSKWIWASNLYFLLRVFASVAHTGFVWLFRRCVARRTQELEPHQNYWFWRSCHIRTIGNTDGNSRYNGLCKSTPCHECSLRCVQHAHWPALF